MQAIAHAYTSNQECSVQVVYHCLSELWLRKVFPGVIYTNTNLSQKRFKILWSKEEISCLPNESEDVLKKMLDMNMGRPDESFLNDRYGCVNLLCYAKFLCYHYLAAIPQNHGWQPVELSDGLPENNFSNKIYPSIIPLITFTDKLNCRKVLCVLHQRKVRIMNLMHFIC